MNKIAKSALILIGILSVAGAHAADHRILMLDTGADGIMVFEPAFLKIAKGDRVTFVARDPGHNVVSRLVPDGVPPWKGTVSTDLTVSFDQEGVYIYECDLHTPLGMVGVIQVGRPVNLKQARDAADGITAGMAMSAERLQQYLEHVEK
jgi:pseudoazurin